MQLPMINDIFSKNLPTTNSLTNQLITIDYREKNSLVPAELISLGHKTILKELKVGDYLINDTIIERKEIKDFVQSMINGRLKKQLEEIKQYPKYLLIIETPSINLIQPSRAFQAVGDGGRGLNNNSLKGFILSILLHHKVPIIFTLNPKETAQYISLLAKKSKNISPLNPTKKQLTKKEKQQYILESFSGIGPKKAKLLLEKFSSLNMIFNATKKELIPILGKNTNDFLNQLN